MIIASRIFILFLVIAVFYIYCEFEGYPWLKWQAHKRIEKYLKDNFTTHVTIKNIRYEFKMRKHYFAWVYSEGEDFEFQCAVIDDEIKCDFFSNYWAFQIKTELGEKLKPICGDDIKIRPRILNDFIIRTDIKNLQKYQQLFDKLPDYKAMSCS